MSRFYFINEQGTQIGPIEREHLLKSGITRTTLVWKEGSPNWIPADQEPELAEYFASTYTSPVPPIPTMSPSQSRTTFQPQRDTSFAAKPSSYMWLAILSTLLCCLPLGIVSIVYASKVDSNWATGNYNDAIANSEKAKKWGIASIATSFVLGIIYIFILLLASWCSVHRYKHLSVIIFAVVVALAAITVYYNFNPLETSWMPKCPSKLLTGLDCPACGAQRAFHAMLHGRITEAIQYNLFLFIGIPYLLLTVWSTFTCFPGNKRVRSISHHPAIAYGYIALFFIWWIARNLL